MFTSLYIRYIKSPVSVHAAERRRNVGYAFVFVCVLNYEEMNVQPTIDFGKSSR